MMRCWSCTRLIMTIADSATGAGPAVRSVEALCSSCGARYKITTEYLGQAARKAREYDDDGA